MKKHGPNCGKGDIVIEGDLQAQKDVRFALYHLYSFVRGTLVIACHRWAFPALVITATFSGILNCGCIRHYFALQPEITKSILEYRFNRLAAARQNAFSHGYQGAMFPWESSDEGTEDTTGFQALTGPFQHHITGCVGWAFWKYYQVTHDKYGCVIVVIRC